MTLLDAPPAPGVRAAGAGRRRWPLVVAASAALLGLLWTAALVVAPRTVALSAGTTALSGTAPVRTVPEYGPRGMHVVGYDHGAALDLRVPVRNDGPLPVTVTAASTGAGPFPLLAVTAEAMPLRLGPGETGEVVLRGVLGNCAYYHEREAQTVDALSLVVRPGVPLAGAATTVVPLDVPLFLRSPMIVRCPDRQLDRQAQDRSSA
ncbi:MAG TPA: hypothetical protein VNU66_11185, partial [Mycobacteriales bacterium]|nr:hypothetical protein [Mycobacteriales bacterium]